MKDRYGTFPYNCTGDLNDKKWNKKFGKKETPVPPWFPVLKPPENPSFPKEVSKLFENSLSALSALFYLYTFMKASKTNFDWQAYFLWHFISQSGTIFSPSVGQRRFWKCRGVDCRRFLTLSPLPLPPHVLVLLRSGFSRAIFKTITSKLTLLLRRLPFTVCDIWLLRWRWSRSFHCWPCHEIWHKCAWWRTNAQILQWMILHRFRCKSNIYSSEQSEYKKNN